MVIKNKIPLIICFIRGTNGSINDTVSKLKLVPGAAGKDIFTSDNGLPPLPLENTPFMVSFNPVSNENFSFNFPDNFSNSTETKSKLSGTNNANKASNISSTIPNMLDIKSAIPLVTAPKKQSTLSQPSPLSSTGILSLDRKSVV